MMCMMAVPFILMVMPTGSTKSVISSEQPSSFTQVSRFRGRAGQRRQQKGKGVAIVIFINIKKGWGGGGGKSGEEG